MERENALQVRKIIENVSVFRRMTLWEADAILQLCTFKTYAKGDLIYSAGQASDEMLILIQGSLVATSETGATLGQIAPGTTTGEMGLLTGSPRSANVVASDKSAGFVIRRADLQRLFQQNERLQLKVYENLVAVLCSRLQDANVRIDAHASQAV